MRALLSRLFSKRLPSSFYQDQYPYTPDIQQLQNRERHRLFVPDEFMKPHFMHEKLGEGREFRYNALALDDFTLWMRDMGKASRVIPMQVKYRDHPFCSIRGEVWSIRTENLLELDKYKLNGVQFNRKRVHIGIPHSEKGQREINTEYKAWMYIGVPDYWNAYFVRGNRIIERKDGEVVRHGRITDNETYYLVKTYSPHNDLLGKLYYFYGSSEYTK